ISAATSTNAKKAAAQSKFKTKAKAVANNKATTKVRNSTQAPEIVLLFGQAASATHARVASKTRTSVASKTRTSVASKTTTMSKVEAKKAEATGKTVANAQGEADADPGQSGRDTRKATMRWNALLCCQTAAPMQKTLPRAHRQWPMRSPYRTCKV